MVVLGMVGISTISIITYFHCSAAAETQVYDVGSNPAPWSPDEQKLLEQAMRTFPASVPDRWDKIAEAIPLRSKKDCMKRYKVCKARYTLGTCNTIHVL